jgi:hypothetical protein
MSFCCHSLEVIMSIANRGVLKRWLALLVLGCFLAAPVGANGSQKKPVAEKVRSKSGQQPGKLTFREAPSHETPAARAQRLRRECKGRPNAGACLGHTH